MSKARDILKAIKENDSEDSFPRDREDAKGSALIDHMEGSYGEVRKTDDGKWEAFALAHSDFSGRSSDLTSVGVFNTKKEAQQAVINNMHIGLRWSDDHYVE